MQPVLHYKSTIPTVNTTKDLPSSQPKFVV